MEVKRKRKILFSLKLNVCCYEAGTNVGNNLIFVFKLLLHFELSVNSFLFIFSLQLELFCTVLYCIDGVVIAANALRPF